MASRSMWRAPLPEPSSAGRRWAGCARVARLDTYARSPVSVPFYQSGMGYERRSIIFQKEL
jgi:hypothetical protein